MQSGKVWYTSLTIDLNLAFLILWLVVQVASGFGFGSYQPPAEFVVIAPALVAIINLALRYWRTRQPISR